MKKQLLIVCIVLISTLVSAQTYLINGATGNGNFETTPYAPTWTLANQSTNFWDIGTVAFNGGARGAYVRNSGGTNSYTKTTSQKSYIYTAVSYTIPTTANCAYLSFWYKGQGESSFDYMQAFLTTTAPTAGAVPPAAATQVGATRYNLQGSWTQVTIPIPSSLFGIAQKVLFYWINDNSAGLDPAIAIDDVQLYYNTTGPVNDDCIGATTLSVGAFGTCTNTTGDITCASNSGIVAPVGTADDDLWYSFVATNSSHTINISSTSINPVIEVFSGACGSLVSIANANASTITVNGLTVGTTYKIRIYSFAATKPSSSTFNVCVTTPASCPANLGTGNVTIPSLPYTITGKTTCGQVNDITSANVISCGSTNYFTGEDVVYNFTPTTSGGITINLTSTGTFTGLMLYQGCPFSGNCLTYTQNSSGSKSINCFPVTAGITYYLVIDSYSSPVCNPYDLTISAPTAISLPNDDPCGAITVPINAACTYTTYDLTGACGSSVLPPSCGTYNGQDVWFKFVVPSAGTYIIDTKEGTMINSLMAVYRGASCGGTLTEIACDNDASANGLMSYISNGTYLAGETIYIRVMPDGAAIQGTFQLCVSNPCITGNVSNDNPCNATTIVIGNTASGDNTCATNGVGTTEPAINTGLTAVSGTYNSVWYKFVAPSGGSVQIRTVLGSLRNTIMSVYTGTCGTSLSSVDYNDDIALCTSSSSNFNSGLTLNALTVGATYYIMVDGKYDATGDFSVAVITTNIATNWPLVRGSDCGAAKDLCDDTTSIANPGFQSFGNYCDMNGSGGTCLGSGEKNSVWFNIPISAAGTLAFDIVANDYGTPTNPFNGQANPSYVSASDETDYDFAIWKVSGTIASTCATIASTPATNLVGCNYSGLGVTGLNGTTTNVAPATYGTGFNGAYEKQVNAATGDSYLLMINNFANSVNGFTLKYTGTAAVNFAAGAATTSVSWTGGNSTTTWTNTDNWGGCTLPSCTVDATIDPLYVQPTITAAMGIVSVKDLTINPGATLTLAAGATLKVCGSIFNYGNFICSPTSTVLFNDEILTHTLNGNLVGIDGFGNLTIQDASTVLLTPNCKVTTNVDFDVKGNFTTVNSTSIFDVNQKYMKLAGNFTNAAQNNTFTNSNGPAGTLEFNGNTTQTYTQGGNLNLNNVVINQSVASNVNIATNKLIVSPTGTLTLTQGKITFPTPTTQEVLVQNPATTAVSVGNTTSYVEGQLRRFLTTTSIGSYDFPVGNSTKGYELINLNFTAATGALSNFSLAANFNNWGGTFPFPTPLGVTECTVLFNNPWLDNGNWSVDTYDQTATGGVKGLIAVPGTYNATLYNRNYTNASTSNGWSIGKSPSVAPVWAMDGVCQATPVTAVRRNNMTGFSRFATIQSALVPLPIELANFNANAELTYNNVEWITATETNNNYFEVEASEDAVNFKVIANIKGAGNSIRELRYAIKDKNYYPTTYYRLKQVDFDGKYSYSELRVVTRFNKNSKDVFMVDISPNPTQNEVKIVVTNGVKEEYRIDVLSVDGKLLMKRIIDVKDFTKGVTIDLSALENGLYHVEISNSVGYVMKKVIKQ